LERTARVSTLNLPIQLCAHRFADGRLFTSERVKPVVYSEQVYGLEDVGKALDAVAARQTWGKAVIKIREEKTGEKAKL
jgi:NADPH2:quinone reductase